MAERLFGTDGMRGAFGVHPLDAVTVTHLGWELARALAPGAAGDRPRVLLGGDTRDSTPELCRWLASGLEAGGADLRYGGVLPTPAVAYLTPRLGADAGIVVSASHNPYPDNGIKLLDAAGRKWSDEAEAALEERLLVPGERPARPEAALVADPEAAPAYLAHLAGSLPAGRPLAGLRVALDAANGAASAFAGPLFERLGAAVRVLHAAPDGSNINRGCGSTHPEDLQALMAAGGHDLGVAFDGDADRAVFVDEAGSVRDGDAALYLWARQLHRAGRLDPPRVVATTMSNLGLERALGSLGIELVRCGVGDRQVVETLEREGLRLGGEQSGHIVHLGLSSTGDGLMTALQVAAILSEAGGPLSALLEDLRRFPQVLVNVRVSRKEPFEGVPEIRAAARRVEDALGTDGRLLLRYSGTEPLARVMIEGPEQEKVEELAAGLGEVILQRLG